MKVHGRNHGDHEGSFAPAEAQDRRARLYRVADFIATGGYSLLRPRSSPAHVSPAADRSTALRVAETIETGGYNLLDPATKATTAESEVSE